MSLFFSLLSKVTISFTKNYNKEIDNMILSLFDKITNPKQYLVDNKNLIITDYTKIINIQNILKKDGFLKEDDINGIWDEKNFIALTLFQKENKLPHDGKLNKETLDFLNLGTKNV